MLSDTPGPDRIVGLQGDLDAVTGLGEVCTGLDQERVTCLACGHRCTIAEGGRGICRVRYNADGGLRVPWGYVAGLQCDPIEKKPFYHVYPGSNTLTFGMLGCDFHCPFCQNWVTSQALRDPSAGVAPRPVSAHQLTDMAVREGAMSVTSSYNEPMVSAEWTAEVFRQARARGLRTAAVSNGYATPECLAYLRPLTDCLNVDLKTMSERGYRQLGGVLQVVLDAIARAHELGFWVELVTLLVPGWNTSAEELRDAAEYIAGVSPDIPWHVTAFHRDYRMTEPRNAAPSHLLEAAEIGREAGLHFVYAGNLPSHVGDYENTRCPDCHALLVQRSHFSVSAVSVSDAGTCPACGRQIPGMWGAVEHPSGGRVRPLDL